MSEQNNPFDERAKAEEKKIDAAEKREAEAANRPFAMPNPVKTEAERAADKTTEDARLKALTDAKVAEEQKAKAVKDAEAAQKKAAEVAAAREKQRLADDEAKQKKAKESAARIEEKLKKANVNRDKEKDELLEEATVILRQYGVESNIPVNSGYWGLMNSYRQLESEARR